MLRPLPADQSYPPVGYDERMNLDILPRPDALLAELVALPAPPGQEDAVRDYLVALLAQIGVAHAVDKKGNVRAAPIPVDSPIPERPRIVVCAHMDEIALMVTGFESPALEPFDCACTVASLGGLYAWKWGETPVELLPLDGLESVTGVLSFGSIHTTHPQSAAQAARDGRTLEWEHARIHTGLSERELRRRGIGLGSRVVLAGSRRHATNLAGDKIACPFLDDRADIVAGLIALVQLAKSAQDDENAANLAKSVVFLFTVSEEVGGHGAAYVLREMGGPELCIALEIGAKAWDNSIQIIDQPTVWVSDSYATMDARDLAEIQSAARDAGLSPQFHVVTRGGSDASIAASFGLCARAITLAFPADNSHGLEIMHKDAPARLADLLVVVLQRLLR